MERLIVFDSIFGNTEKIARRIGKALGSRASTATLHVREVRAEHLEGLKLLLVGSPTRAFRATRAIVGFVGSVAPGALHGVGVAAFDPKISTADTNSRFLSFMVYVPDVNAGFNFGEQESLRLEKTLRTEFPRL